ncbi:MAG: hypothetical protein JW751_05785 [Polyangiaceae bacterium]|nr:hypothetical protein [Polyangiaceae bacterium]
MLTDGEMPEEVRGPVLATLRSPFPVTRATALAELSTYRIRGLRRIARSLAIEDPCAAVRREAVFSMVRAGDRDGILALGQTPARTGAERSARIVAIGALGFRARCRGNSLFEQLLLEASRRYGRGPVLRQLPRR